MGLLITDKTSAFGRYSYASFTKGALALSAY